MAILVRCQSHSWEEGRPNLWAMRCLSNQSAPADGFQGLLQAVIDPSFLEGTLDMISYHPFLCKQKLIKVWNLSQSNLPEVTQPLTTKLTQEPGSPDPWSAVALSIPFLHLLWKPNFNSSGIPYSITRPTLHTQVSGIRYWDIRSPLTAHLRWSSDIILIQCGCRNRLSYSPLDSRAWNNAR